jgi:hypothetical protein
MATNLARFFRERYKVAIDKWETEQHEEALTELSDLLMDPQLPLLYRLKANMALAHSQEDWFHAEEHRTDAERVYDHIRTKLGRPEGDTRWPDQERELVAIREQLDILADEQKQTRPLPLSPDQDDPTTASSDVQESSQVSAMDSPFSPSGNAAHLLSESTFTPLPVRSQPATPTNLRFQHSGLADRSSPYHKRDSPEK